MATTRARDPYCTAHDRRSSPVRAPVAPLQDNGARTVRAVTFREGTCHLFGKIRNSKRREFAFRQVRIDLLPVFISNEMVGPRTNDTIAHFLNKRDFCNLVAG